MHKQMTKPKANRAQTKTGFRPITSFKIFIPDDFVLENPSFSLDEDHLGSPTSPITPGAGYIVVVYKPTIMSSSNGEKIFPQLGDFLNFLRSKQGAVLLGKPGTFIANEFGKEKLDIGKYYVSVDDEKSLPKNSSNSSGEKALPYLYLNENAYTFGNTRLSYGFTREMLLLGFFDLSKLKPKIRS